MGGGIRSLNVALRQRLDLYACVRPVRYFRGVPSPVRSPEQMDVVIFRENTEDVYAGIEWMADSPEAAKLIGFLAAELGMKHPRRLRHRDQADLPPSATQRLVRMAIL